MKITDALIRRFLDGKCDELEQEAVKAYLASYPELWQKLLTEKSWEDFVPGKSLPPAVSDRMLAVIKGRVVGENKAQVKWYAWASVAAVVVLAFGIYLVAGGDRKITVPPIAVKVMETKPGIVQYAWQQTINNTRKPITHVLADGSKVELIPGSVLKYTVPFVNNRRDVYLAGEAIFHVAENHAKPFTVYAGRLATTALGTVFRVTAFKSNHAVTKVYLLSGKVRVSPDSLLRVQGVKTAYLLPGQELQMDLLRQVAVISSKSKTDHSQPPVIAKTIPGDGSDRVLAFHNEPVGNIFKTLGRKYRRNIFFDEKLLTGMNFTGNFDSNKESFIDFIKTICLLNNLTVREDGTQLSVISQ